MDDLASCIFNAKGFVFLSLQHAGLQLLSNDDIRVGENDRRKDVPLGQGQQVHLTYQNHSSSEEGGSAGKEERIRLASDQGYNNKPRALWFETFFCLHVEIRP